MDVHTIFFIGGAALNFVLAFSTSKYLFSFSYHCVMILSFRSADLQQLITIGIKIYQSVTQQTYG